MPARPRLDIDETTRQLGLLLEAELAPAEAVAVLRAAPESRAVARFLHSAAAALEERNDLAEALARHPAHFEPFLAALARGASERGELAAFLIALSGYLEELRELGEGIRASVRRALFYPLFIIALAVLVLAFLATSVVPEYAALFADFGAELPAMTGFVMKLTQWFTAFSSQIVGAVILAWVTAKILGRIFDAGGLPWLGGPLSWLAFKTPLLGGLMRLGELVRLLRTWSFSLARGYTAEQALECSIATARTSYFRNALGAAHEDVRGGVALPDALRRRRAFPRRLVQAAAAAARVRSPAQLFERMADLYAGHLARAIEPTTRRLHVVFLVLTGFVVGFFVLAMYLPMFKMGQVL